MKIMLDATSLINYGGTGVYALELLRKLLALDKVNVYYVILPRGREDVGLPAADNVRYVWVDFSSVLDRIKCQFTLRKLVQDKAIDLVHFTKGTGSLILPRRTKLIITAHDILPITHPEYLSIKEIIYWRLILPRMIRDCDHIITVSHYSRDQIVGRYPSSREKISVIYNGFNSSEMIHSNSSDRYFLFVGRLSQRKNISNMLEAFKRISLKHEDVKLKVAGANAASLRSTLVHEGLEDKVNLLGYVTENEKNALYSNAQALLFTSFAEGFGIPILEAQSLSCPVITSNCTSMPEVGGAAALYVNPEKIDDIEAAMEVILSNEPMTRSLKILGNENVKKYSWEKCSSQTHQLYEYESKN